ncbi:MAG: class I SAM-dependent methyltransferase [Comamonadaceae bacterium]|nr:class I SAM-dependent methyltransferase [Comamonadaceae bacterium]
MRRGSRARVRPRWRDARICGDATDAVRLVFGEADRLPGLDRRSLRATSWWCSSRRAGVRSAARRCCSTRSSPPPAAPTSTTAPTAPRASARAWTLRDRRGARRRAARADRRATSTALRYGVDVRRGHKTGFYIDQRDNRSWRARWRSGTVAAGHAPRVLNCFCYTGGFSLGAGRGGAGAGAVDRLVGRGAGAGAATTSALNGLRRAGRVHTGASADVFEALRALQQEGAAPFDLIVLDPPKFALDHHHVGPRGARPTRTSTSMRCGCWRRAATC